MGYVVSEVVNCVYAKVAAAKTKILMLATPFNVPVPSPPITVSGQHSQSTESFSSFESRLSLPNDKTEIGLSCSIPYPKKAKPNRTNVLLSERLETRRDAYDNSLQRRSSRCYHQILVGLNEPGAISKHTAPRVVGKVSLPKRLAGCGVAEPAKSTLWWMIAVDQSLAF